VHLTIYILL